MATEKISGWQFIFLIVNTIFPTALLTVPSITTKYAAQQAWESILIATMIGIITVFLSSALALQFPNDTLPGIAEQILNPWFGKIVGSLFLIYFLFVGIVIVREFEDFMSDVFMTTTPPIIFALVMMCLSCYAVYQGLEVFARINMIILVVSFIGFFISTLLSFKDVNFQNLLPLFEQPFSRLLLGAFVPASWMSECAILLFLAPHLKNPQEVRMRTLIAVMLIGTGLAWTLIGTISLIGPTLLSIYNYPTFNTFRKIQVGAFLEHIDALFISIWISTMFSKITIFFYGFISSLKQTFKLTSEKPFLLASAALWIMLSLSSWKNSNEFKDHLLHTIPTLLLFYNLVLISVFLLIAFIGRSISQRKMMTK